jgi:DNA repair exonuclease SbcCD ATPase subunit
MKSLKFKRLLLLSNSIKSANLFEFSKTLNLITATDNSVGKSTLLKLLLWGLGCEPALDTTWNAQDCKTIVDFEIEENNYRIQRYKNQIIFSENNSEVQEFQKITGDFSIKFAEIVGFKALLPNQSTGIVETPPPGYYFLPFYIDQKRSWAKAWDNFDNLGQYQNWKSTIIKYHVGLLTPEHFEIETEKSEKKETQKIIETEVVKIDTALEVVESYIPQSLQTVTTIDAINKITESIKEDLKSLQQCQEKLLNDMANYNADKVYLVQQQIMTEKLISELDKDYKFSVENIEDEEIECPLCGVIHDNSILNRASIMTDKTQAENQLKELVGEIIKIESKLSKNEQELIKARNQINEINEKYVIEEENETTINFNQIIESIAGKSIKESVTQTKLLKQSEIKQIEDDLKKLKKEQKKLTTKETIDSINESFNSILSKYIKTLDAEAVNLSEINSPLDYNKIIEEGGAAEGVRAILAYYLTVFTMVEKYGNEVKSALIIDTPNQQEQSHTNYEKIVNLLTNEFSDDTQIIMSAMENEHLNPFVAKANVITLNNDKLLLKEKYDELKDQFI